MPAYDPGPYPGAPPPDDLVTQDASTATDLTDADVVAIDARVDAVKKEWQREIDQAGKADTWFARKILRDDSTIAAGYSDAASQGKLYAALDHKRDAIVMGGTHADAMQFISDTGEPLYTSSPALDDNVKMNSGGNALVTVGTATVKDAVAAIETGLGITAGIVTIAVVAIGALLVFSPRARMFVGLGGIAT